MKCYPGKEKYPNLLSPIRIGNIRLKNRIIAAPTSPSMITTEGLFTPEMIAYLAEKARGGAAAVTYGESIVHSPTGKSHNKQLQLDAFGVRQGLTEAARAIHNAGAYANIQLSHGGKYGGLLSVGGDEGKTGIAYGPSDELTPLGTVHAMSEEMIEEIISSYGTAAKLVKECGFDMVQVHAAHGWLFSQFLSPVMNRRKDQYGGSLENRARFLIRSLGAVRNAVGLSFPIEIRISGDDLSPSGLNMEQCIEVAELIDNSVDLINVSCGNHEDPELFCRTHPSSFLEHGANVYLAAEIKKHVKTPVACVGALNDPGQMEAILADGQADIVEIGRAELADPYIAYKAMRNRADDITPCIRCYECFASTGQNEMVKCTVNPVTGQELHRAQILPVTSDKTLLVIGGGPAGMEAAITASRRGMKVILAEKKEMLGGNLQPAGAAYFKQDIRDLCEILVRRVERENIDVRLNTEVTPEWVRSLSPDALVVAIGSEELRPPIKGINRKNVIMAIDAELHPEILGQKVVIMGGGLVGAEAAVSFAHEGHQVDIVEMKETICEDVNSFYRGGLMPQVKRAAALHTSSTVTEITETGVLVERNGKISEIMADSVVCALGFRSPHSLVDQLCDEIDESFIVGDCARVGKIYDAMNGGYYAALQIRND